jgi:hypothetical protein
MLRELAGLRFGGRGGGELLVNGRTANADQQAQRGAAAHYLTYFCCHRLHIIPR